MTGVSCESDFKFENSGFDSDCDLPGDLVFNSGLTIAICVTLIFPDNSFFISRLKFTAPMFISVVLSGLIIKFFTLMPGFGNRVIENLEALKSARVF